MSGDRPPQPDQAHESAPVESERTHSATSGHAESAALVTDPMAETPPAGDAAATGGKRATPTPPLKHMGDRGNQIAQVVMCIFMICLAGLLSGYNTLYVPFHGEDLQRFIENDALHRLVTVADAREGLPYAPLTLAGYALNWLLAPFNVTVMHWGSLLFHLGNGVLLYLVARQLLPRKTGEPVAMLAGLAFVAHPAHVESLAYLVGRPFMQGTFFALLAVLVFLQISVSEQHTLDAAIKRFAVLALCYALAVGSHFALLLLPVLLWGFHVVSRPSETLSAGTRRVQQTTLLWLSVLGGAMLLALLNRGQLFPLESGASLTALSELPLRGLRILFPVVDSAPVFPSVEVLSLNLVGGAMFLALGLGAFVLLLYKKPVAVPLLWFCLGLFMLIVTLPGDTLLAQRHLYFAVAGAMLALPFLVLLMAKAAGKQGGAIATSLLLLLIVYAMYASYVHTLQWRFPESFWMEAAESAPESKQPWLHLGAYFRQQTEFAQTPQEAGEWREKQAQAWQEVLARDPESVTAHAALGRALQAQGLPQAAKPHLEFALRHQPAEGELGLRLASVQEMGYEEIGEEALIQALEFYEHAEAHDFLPPEGRLQYAQLATYFGDFDKSLALLEQVRAFEVDDDTPLAARVQQFRTMRNQQEAMKQQANQMMQENPGSTEALLMRAEYQLFIGDRLRTFYLLDGLLQREPENRDAWTLMGVVRAALGQEADFLRERGDQYLADREVWRVLIVRCMSGGQFDEAERYAAHYLEGQDPAAISEDITPAILMADFALELEQAMLAGIVLQQTIETDPDSYAPWLRLARIAQLQNNTQGFQEYYREAAQRGAPREALDALEEEPAPEAPVTEPPIAPEFPIEEGLEPEAPETPAAPEVPRVIIR